jgi:hypothetical protein
LQRHGKLCRDTDIFCNAVANFATLLRIRRTSCVGLGFCPPFVVKLTRMKPAKANEDLLSRIRQKRLQVERFISAELPRKRRLLNMTILGGTLAATLTAFPAVGGQSFTAWLTKTFGLGSPSWQILCGAASISSIVATVATQLLKSHHIEEHVTRAQGCRAKLEVLEVGLTGGQLQAPQATTEYMKCVEEIAFLEVPDAK